MSIIIAAEVLAEVVGTLSSGPAGFNVRYDVASDATLDPNNKNVEMKLNESSLAAARAQNEGGINKEVAKTLAPQSGAMRRHEERSNQADTSYMGLFGKTGVDRGVGRSLNNAPRPNYRSALGASTAPVLSKNPLLRVRQRHLLRLRQTFDEIANVKKKLVSIDPEKLPQAELRKMVVDALQHGKMVTPAGTIEKTMKLAGMTPQSLGKLAPKLTPNKKRQWALFFNPEMVPSGWVMD